MAFAGASLGIVYFWWQIFEGDLFIAEELTLLIDNFDAYYQWKQSFVIPECLLAIGLMVSAFLLWMDVGGNRKTSLAAASSGAALFLGVLTLNFGFATGLYAIPHSYANEALSFDLSITAIGVLGLTILGSKKIKH